MTTRDAFESMLQVDMFHRMVEEITGRTCRESNLFILIKKNLHNKMYEITLRKQLPTGRFIDTCEIMTFDAISGYVLTPSPQELYDRMRPIVHSLLEQLEEFLQEGDDFISQEEAPPPPPPPRDASGGIRGKYRLLRIGSIFKKGNRQ